jgi:ABC-type branched-subunit amino acid transport system substrate-binding protein
VKTFKQKSVFVLGILVIAIISASYVYYINFSPEHLESEDSEPFGSQDIIIGVLADYAENIPKYELILEYAEEKIKTYCNDSGLPYKFSFEVRSAEGMAAIALELTEEWHRRGINLIMGPPWSSMFCVTRRYADENDMIVMSHESTSPILAVDDNGFRLTIHDFKEAQVLTRLFEEDHVEAVVCLSRADAWGEGLVVELVEHYEGELFYLDYSAETTSFLYELKWADETVQSLTEEYGEGNVAFLVFSFNEIGTILNQSTAFPTLQGVTWYGPGLVNEEDVSGEVGDVAARLNLTSFAPLIPQSSELEELNVLYNIYFKEDIDFYKANIYDVCWILSLSVIDAGSDSATALKTILPDVASSYTGITGDCTLDRYGDRNVAFYGVYRYEDVNGEHQWSLIQEYMMDFKEVYNREEVH